MRIAVVTQDEPFYLPPALDAFCRARAGDVIAMVVLPAFNESMSATARRLHAFYGTRDFLRLAGRFVAAKVADRFNRVYAVTRAFSAQDVARRHGIRLLTPDDVNRAAFLRTLRDEVRPDLLVSIAASQILKRKVLDVPPLGCINLHSAPLPRFQGMMPNFWTMLHQEPEAAVTVHYMAEALDAGDVLIQRPVPILPDDSLDALMRRSKRVGVEALIDAVDGIEAGTLRATAMDVDRSTYFSFPTRDDARRLRRLGRTLL